MKEIADEFAVKHRHIHHTSSSGRARLALRVISVISPLRSRMTLSAMAAIAVLWVMTATRV